MFNAISPSSLTLAPQAHFAQTKPVLREAPTLKAAEQMLAEALEAYKLKYCGVWEGERREQAEVYFNEKTAMLTAPHFKDFNFVATHNLFVDQQVAPMVVKIDTIVERVDQFSQALNLTLSPKESTFLREPLNHALEQLAFRLNIEHKHQRKAWQQKPLSVL
jgi:hypothetical protein